MWALTGKFGQQVKGIQSNLVKSSTNMALQRWGKKDFEFWNRLGSKLRS